MSETGILSFIKELRILFLFPSSIILFVIIYGWSEYSDSISQKPNLDKSITIKERIHNTQGSVKYKHYGKLIIELIQEAVDIKDNDLQTYIVDHIAQQMKRSYLNWNQSNVQDTQIWNDLDEFAEKKLKIDKSKVIPVFQPNVRKKVFYKKSNRKHYSRK